MLCKQSRTGHPSTEQPQSAREKGLSVLLEPLFLLDVPRRVSVHVRLKLFEGIEEEPRFLHQLPP